MSHKRKNVVKFFAILGSAMLLIALTATWTLTDESSWYPSKWGKDDQRGAANLLTATKVLEAASLIKEGKVYQLGRVYEAGMPLFGTRHYSLLIPQTGSTDHANKVTWHDEIVSGEIGQIGTQFDGLGHIGIGDLYYNGNNRLDFAKPDGLKKLGVENVGVFVTRGVLIDVAGYKGVEHLEGGYEITVEDIEGRIEKAGRGDTSGRCGHHSYRLG